MSEDCDGLPIGQLMTGSPRQLTPKETLEIKRDNLAAELDRVKAALKIYEEKPEIGLAFDTITQALRGNLHY